jgi:hypothetical protein
MSADLACYADGHPVAADEEAVLAARRQPLAHYAGDRSAERSAARSEAVLFHVDCFPRDSGEWVEIGRGPAGKLHETPP